MAGVNFVTIIGLAYSLIKQNLVPQKDEEIYLSSQGFTWSETLTN
jgi:hypothetical protein